MTPLRLMPVAASSARVVSSTTLLIERGLLRREVAEDLHLHFVRKILYHGSVRLEPPQDERRRQLPRSAARPRNRPSSEWGAETAPELGLVAEKAGVQEVHDGPQLTDVVLDRRARERDPVVGRSERAARDWRVSGILDVLRLVENDSGPRDLFQLIDIAMQERIAGDDERVARGLLDEFLAACARQSMMDEHRKLGSKTRRFLPPVADHRSGADQEHRAVDAVGAVAFEQRESLDGLSEAHIVGQTGAQSVLSKESEPGESAHLIRPQSALKTRRWRKLFKARMTRQFPQQFADPAFAARLFESSDARRRIGSAQRHADDVAGGRGLPLPKVQRRANALGVEGQPLAVHFDERSGGFREPVQFLARVVLAADGHFPVELHQLTE